MRGANKWIVTLLINALVTATVAFLVVGLMCEDSWPGQMIHGAGVITQPSPDLFPKEEMVSAAPTVRTPTPGGLGNAEVTFQGLWGGYCPIWGTDTAYPGGVRYTAGTLNIRIGDRSFQGYSADLRHTIRTGETYRANLHAGAEKGLCEAQWIMTNFRRDTPGTGLRTYEEGAAIQAAIWHYVEGFQPVWKEDAWCGKEAVYRRALAIIDAAQGQCIPIPAELSLTADADLLSPGEATGLTAQVLDQQGRPFPGQVVNFAATAGSTLSPAKGVTDAAGQARSFLRFDGEGTHTATASMAGTTGITTVDPVNAPKPRLLAIKPVSYSDQAAVDVSWKAASAEVSIAVFEAKIQMQDGAVDKGILVRWETTSEVNNRGFNLYRSNGEKGPWTPLNAQIIPSKVTPGSSTGASYEFLDEQGDPRRSFYLLESVSTDGQTIQHGPIRPTP